MSNLGCYNYVTIINNDDSDKILQLQKVSVWYVVNSLSDFDHRSTREYSTFFKKPRFGTLGVTWKSEQSWSQNLEGAG